MELSRRARTVRRSLVAVLLSLLATAIAVAAETTWN